MVDLTQLQARPVNAPAQGGSSRGTGIEKSLGSLFENVTNIGVAAVNVADERNKILIEEEITAVNDRVLGDFGADIAPREIQEGGSRLEALHSVFEQGKLKDSNYYAQLSSTVRRLKSRNPAYRNEIDKIVQRVTGVRPANALRRALLNEMESEERQRKSSQTADQNDIDRWAERGYISPSEINTAEGDINKLRPLAYKRAAEDAQLKRDKAQLEFENTGIENQEKKRKLAIRTLRAETSGAMSRIMQEGIAAGTGKMGISGIMEAVQAARADGNISGDEANEITNNFAIMRNNASTIMQSVISQEAFKDLTQEEKQEIVDSHMAKLKDLEEAIFNKNYGIAAATANQMAHQTNDDALKLQQKYPIFRVLDAANKAGGQKLVDDILTQVRRDNSEEVQFGNVTQLFRSTIDNPDAPSAEEVIKDAKEADVDGKGITSLIKGWLTTLKEGTQKQKENVAKILFGSDASEVTKQFDPTSEKQMYREMFSPLMIKNMKGIQDTSPAIWKSYNENAQIVFHRVFKNTVLNSGLDTSIANIPNFEMSFNEETKRFEFSGMPEEANEDFVIRNHYTNVSETLGEINSMLETLEPLVQEGNFSYDNLLMVAQLEARKQTGLYPEELAKRIASLSRGSQPIPVGRFGLTVTEFTPEQAAASAALTEGEAAIANVLDSVESGGGYDTLLGHQQRSGRKFEDTNITKMTLGELKEFTSSKSDYAQYSREAVGRMATPLGRYQIVGKTLRSLQTQMGLDDDTVFSPAVQDRMFLQLMKNRGFDDYKVGRITKRVFLNNLRSEWEGLDKSAAARKKVSQLLEEFNPKKATV